MPEGKGENTSTSVGVHYPYASVIQDSKWQSMNMRNVEIKSKRVMVRDPR